MPVERRVSVVRVEPQWLWLQLEGTCEGCGGCRGRCDLSRRLLSTSTAQATGGESPSEQLRLPRKLAPGEWVANQQAALRLTDEALLVEAGRAYGLPMLGLLLGAAAARWILDGHPLMNAGVLGAAILGTLGALQLSKRYSARSLETGLSLVRRVD